MHAKMIAFFFLKEMQFVECVRQVGVRQVAMGTKGKKVPLTPRLLRLETYAKVMNVYKDTTSFDGMCC
jgi:hypothetical protein